jgi:hypothetical protein
MVSLMFPVCLPCEPPTPTAGAVTDIRCCLLGPHPPLGSGARCFMQAPTKNSRVGSKAFKWSCRLLTLVKSSLMSSRSEQNRRQHHPLHNHAFWDFPATANLCCQYRLGGLKNLLGDLWVSCRVKRILVVSTEP